MTAAGWELGRIDSGRGCLFCNQPVTDRSESCPAFSLAGVAAHRACCGCAAWAGWVRPGLSALDLTVRLNAATQGSGAR
jgi:hypothetical protein